METFETLRLRLRPLSEDDEALYCCIYTDPQMMRYVMPPLALDGARRSFRAARLQSGNVVMRTSWWSASDRQSGSNVGLVTLLHEEEAAEIGAMILEEWQGRGLAVEAIERLIEAAFSKPGLRRLWIRHVPVQTHGAGVARKLGFKREDVAGNSGEVVWRLLREEWNLRKDGARDFATSLADR